MAVLATRAEVARLYGRAGFGATAADLDRGTKMLYGELVASLFPPTSADLRPAPADDAERVDFSGASSPEWRDMYGPITWWTERMRTTSWPLEERMTLFLHDHFATAFASPPNTDVLMLQNQTLRVHALGDFRALCHAITVDAAMLIWLNGTDNVASGINENYARELFELFVVGAAPPGRLAEQDYTEADVKAAAQALTGWRFKHPRTVEWSTVDHYSMPAYLFKTALTPGVRVCSGVWNDGSHQSDHKRVVDAALARPRSARYVATQIVRSFGYVPDPDAAFDGLDPLVEKVAAALRPTVPTGRWDLAAAIRALLLAPEWKGAQPAARQGARQPVETLVHGAKILGVDLYRWFWSSPPSLDDPTGIKEFERKFVDASAQAGQMPFYPPGVGGWPAGAEWFSTTNNLSRYDILHRLWEDFAVNATGVIPPASANVAGWTEFMGLAALTDNTAAKVHQYLAGTVAETEATRQRGLFLLIGTSPDWQVM